MTDSAEARAVLRARLRRITDSDRERRCGTSVVHEHGPAIEASGRPGAWETRWTGVLTCGHIWTCPVCSERLRRKRLQRVMHAMTIAGGRWQMVTLTVRHRPGLPLKSLLRGMMAAWRRTKQGGLLQRIWGNRVSASVRATEVTHGKNGWHPHLHVLVRTSEWTNDERETLEEVWKRRVGEALGPDCEPDAAYGVRWSTPIDVCTAPETERAKYLFKLGAEVAGPKSGRGGSLSSWELAELATRDARAAALWGEFYRGTKGRRMIELDDRATRYAKTPLPGALDAPLSVESTRARVTISVDALELRALREYERRFDPGVLAVILRDVSASECPKTTVKAWLDVVTRRLSYTREDGSPRTSREETSTSPRSREGPRAPPGDTWAG